MHASSSLLLWPHLPMYSPLFLPHPLLFATHPLPHSLSPPHFPSLLIHTFSLLSIFLSLPSSLSSSSLIYRSYSVSSSKHPAPVYQEPRPVPLQTAPQSYLYDDIEWNVMSVTNQLSSEDSTAEAGTFV